MRMLKKIFQWTLIVLTIPLLFGLASLILTYITVPGSDVSHGEKETIYISSNGVHLSIIIPGRMLDDGLRDGLTTSENDLYFMFGWGDSLFYLNTPEWSDLTVGVALKALVTALMGYSFNPFS